MGEGTTDTLPDQAELNDQSGPAGMPRQKVSVEAQLILDGDQLRIVATNLYSGSESGLPDTPIPDAYVRPVLAMFTKVIDISQLPFHLQPTKVTASGGLITIEAQQSNATISLAQLQNSTPPARNPS